MDIEQHLASLRDRVQKATQEEARNDILRERAVSERDEALASLKNDFGLNSVEEAEAELVSLKAELLEKTAELEKTLDSMGV